MRKTGPEEVGNSIGNLQNNQGTHTVGKQHREKAEILQIHDTRLCSTGM
jgi:hypothetical protein